MNLTGNEILSISPTFLSELRVGFPTLISPFTSTSLVSAIFSKRQIRYCQTPTGAVGVCFVPISHTQTTQGLINYNSTDSLLVCASVSSNATPISSNDGVEPESTCPPTHCPNIIFRGDVDTILFSNIVARKLPDSPFEAIYFSNQVIETILNQVDCVGIMVMIVQYPDGLIRLAICGVEEQIIEGNVQYIRQIGNGQLIAYSDIIISIP